MDISWDIIWLASVAFVLAGAVKGIAGIGLPTAALGVMTLGIDPRTAISLILFPMLATNAWQMVMAGDLRRTLFEYWWLIACTAVGVALTTFVFSTTADQVLMGALAFAIILFVWFTWAGWIPKIGDRANTVSQIGFGSAAGFIGGMTATWAVPVAMYLTARSTEKDEFIRVTGLLIFVGSLPLIISYWSLGFFTGPLAVASATMLVPAFLGMGLGLAVRSRLSGDGFRNAILVVFLLLAANLLRKALF